MPQVLKIRALNSQMDLFSCLDSNVDRIAIPDPQLVNRISTFLPSLWFSKPKALSPVVCSVHGWVCVLKDTLECKTCLSRIICPLQYNDPTDKFLQLLTDAHKSTCSCKYSLPSAIYKFPTLDYKSTLRCFINRFKNIPNVLENVISPIDQSLTFHDDLIILDKLITEATELTELTATQLATLKLALFGWEKSLIIDNAVECNLCMRKVGLWGFKDSSFDAETEHRWFCPWIYNQNSEMDCGWKVGMNILLKKNIKNIKYSEIPEIFKTHQRNLDKRVLVLVLGDLGRSPRMQLHAKSFAENGFLVDFVGYSGTKLPIAISSNSNISILAISPAMKIPKCPRFIYVLLAIIRITLQIIQLIIALLALKSPAFIICQTPPAIPTLFLVQFLQFIRNSKLIIDWHNFGYSIMALNLNSSSLIVRFACILEKTCGRHAHLHLCVSKAMKNFLQTEWNFSDRILVLYDKAPSNFKTLNSTEKNHFINKMKPINSGQVSFSESKQNSKNLKKYDYLIVSSTSWTEDEDFSILLDAMCKYDSYMQAQENSLTFQTVSVLLIITGKGPLKEYYLEKINNINFHYVQIKTAWLESEDYPLLLGSADLGISLHTSSSGLDLPMKIVDMFGCGLPVCAFGYNCLKELVKNNVNGLIFYSSDELFQQLLTLLKPQNNDDLHKLKKLKKGTVEFQKDRWSDSWNRNLKPLL